MAVNLRVVYGQPQHAWARTWGTIIVNYRCQRESLHGEWWCRIMQGEEGRGVYMHAPLLVLMQKAHALGALPPQYSSLERIARERQQHSPTWKASESIPDTPHKNGRQGSAIASSSRR